MNNRIRRDKALLVVIDIQEKLLPFIEASERIQDKAAMMIKGAEILQLPIFAFEQYPKGLGCTVPAIKEALGERAATEKTSFSIMGVQDFKKALKETGKEDILLVGIETHVCVLQSALDLLFEGYRVYLVADAAGSRDVNDKNVAIKRMSDAGVTVTTVEAALFEMVDDAKDTKFKEISKLVK